MGPHSFFQQVIYIPKESSNTCCQGLVDLGFLISNSLFSLSDLKISGIILSFA